MANTPPHDSFSFFGIGLQTVAGTPVTPTLWTRKTALSGFYPMLDTFRSDAAFGVLDPQLAEISLRYGKFSHEFELTTGVAIMILTSMLGAAPVAGTITPTQTDWNNANPAIYMPLQPLTIESGQPGENYKFSDALIDKFSIEWKSDGYMIGKIEGKTMVVADLPSATTAVVPTVAFSRSHLALTLGGSALLAESFSVDISTPVDFLEATTGTLLPAGYTRTKSDGGYRSLKASFSKHDVYAASKAKYEAVGTDTLVARMVQSSNILEFNLGAFQYESRSFGNGRVITSWSGGATPSGGNLFLAKNV